MHFSWFSRVRRKFFREYKCLFIFKWVLMHCLWPTQCENISAKTSMALKPRMFSPANLSPSTVQCNACKIQHNLLSITFPSTVLHTYHFVLLIRLWRKDSSPDRTHECDKSSGDGSGSNWYGNSSPQCDSKGKPSSLIITVAHKFVVCYQRMDWTIIFNHLTHRMKPTRNPVVTSRFCDRWCAHTLHPNNVVINDHI